MDKRGEALLEGMDKRTKRYKRTRSYLEGRARPGEEKTVTFKHTEDKNYGLPVTEEVTLIAGKCPCAICGHEWMWECEEASFEGNGGCDCCSSTCT